MLNVYQASRAVDTQYVVGDTVQSDVGANVVIRLLDVLASRWTWV